MIVAIDFDGTVVEHEFPQIGVEAPDAVRWLREIVAAGGQLILWTIRSGRTLEAAVEWFREREIELFGINNHVGQESWSESRKVYAHLYIDDAAFGCPLRPASRVDGRPMVDWSVVGPQVLLLVQSGDGVAHSPKIVLEASNMEWPASGVMKTSRLIALLQEEVKHFGDRDFMMFCPRHSGEDGPPVAVEGLGWYGDPARGIRASFLECVECHYEGMADNAEDEAMGDIADGPMSLEEFDSL